MTALVDALSIGVRETVAFTGAGGKTTALFRAARELHAAGRRVVITTTTRIYVPEPAPDLALVAEPDPDRLAAALSQALARWQIPVAGTAITDDGKLVGVPPDWVADIGGLDGVTHVLVEADGAARLPITAPRDGEPVIPAATTLVVPVAGIDALGARIDRVAHRPERVAALTCLTPEAALDARAIARVVLGRDGNTRGTPRDARIVALVNKADGVEEVAAARELARAMHAVRAVRVVIGAVGTRDAVRAVVDP